MGWLDDYFDRVVVINLDRRPDRYQRFLDTLRSYDWPFRPFERFAAVDGETSGVPAWWQQTAGAWGCLRSHTRVLEDAIRDGVERLLVLEDDAVFAAGLRAGAERFLRAAPPDWEQLYLGGEHLRAPRKLSDDVYACVRTTRTHAYAVSHAFMPRMYQYISNASDYITYPGSQLDHRLGALHETGTIKVYAPPAWLIGQTAGRSDVGAHAGETQFWNGWSSASERAMVVVLGLHHGGANEVAGLLQTLGLHFGYSLGGYETPRVEDTGLAAICEQIYPFPVTERTVSLNEASDALRDWCWMIAREAADAGTIGAACYPQLCAMHEEMAHAWPRLKVIDVRGDFQTALGALQARFANDSRPEFSEERLIAVQRFLDSRRQEWLGQHDQLTIDLARLRAHPLAVTAELRAFLGLAGPSEAISDRRRLGHWF